MEKIQRLELTKKALDDLTPEIEGGQYPASMLEDLKESVDHTRTLIWTMMKIEEEKKATQRGYVFDLGEKLINFRLHRAQRLMQQIEADIDISEIEISTPGIGELSKAVNSLHDRLTRLLRTGG